MGADIDFGGGRSAHCAKAFLRVILAAIRRHAPDDPELRVSVEKEDVLHAFGGWSLTPDDPVTPTSSRALRRLQEVSRTLQSELPEAIADWNAEFRPQFFAHFAEFRRALDARIAELSSGEQRETGPASEHRHPEGA